MESGHEACSCTACQASISGSEPAGSLFFFFFFFLFFSFFSFFFPFFPFFSLFFSFFLIFKFPAFLLSSSKKHPQIEILLF